MIGILIIFIFILVIYLDAINFLTCINDLLKIHINSSIYIAILSIAFPVGLALYLFNKENKARQLEELIMKLTTQGIIDEVLSVISCIRHKNIGFLLAAIDGKFISKNTTDFLDDEVVTGYQDEKGKIYMYSAVESLRRSAKIYKDLNNEKYRHFIIFNVPGKKWKYLLPHLISQVIDIKMIDIEYRGFGITRQNSYNIIEAVQKHLEPLFLQSSPSAIKIQDDIIKKSETWFEKHPNLYAENLFINFHLRLQEILEFENEKKFNEDLKSFIKQMILPENYDIAELEEYCDFLIMQDKYLSDCQKFLKTLKINVLL